MFKKIRLLLWVAALFGTLPGRIMAAPNGSDDLLHRIKHVFVIVLENEGFDVTFGPNSKAPLSFPDAHLAGRSPESILRHRPRQPG